MDKSMFKLDETDIQIDDMPLLPLDDMPLLPPGYLESAATQATQKDSSAGVDGGQAANLRPVETAVSAAPVTPVTNIDMSQYISKEEHQAEIQNALRALEDKYKSAAAQPLGDWKEKSSFLKTQVPDAYNDVVAMIEAAINTRFAEIEPLKKGLNQVQAAAAEQNMQQLVAATTKHLEAYGVKDFDIMSLDKDPNFQKFVTQENPESGLTYKQILQNAQNKGKADIAAKVFATYLRQTNPDARDVNNYIGIKGSVKTDVPSPEDAKLYTEKQVQDFYRNKAAGKFSKNAEHLKWAASEEKRIAKAYNEGRIISG
ncbi:hypothetical protein [Candidatus Magnetominusculus xianensis]|uniref:Capsid assembly protein n=1 Tax=Candidatus Magnetominusculus xianensis TaxID=1748249 RepID=A0ABR5SBW4_9BACT|nr:hypothetical protein [Candidatus Magnetominusculus xianensis]KWT73783.1 hypothetical protein ASN18_3365 [Candidatus Magnetominusculus xianensis]MBF0404804.1 hypothetical protein [Nitrospirota bacterium]